MIALFLAFSTPTWAAQPEPCESAATPPGSVKPWFDHKPYLSSLPQKARVVPVFDPHQLNPGADVTEWRFQLELFPNAEDTVASETVRVWDRIFQSDFRADNMGNRNYKITEGESPLHEDGLYHFRNEKTRPHQYIQIYLIDSRGHVVRIMGETDYQTYLESEIRRGPRPKVQMERKLVSKPQWWQIFSAPVYTYTLNFTFADGTGRVVDVPAVQRSAKNQEISLDEHFGKTRDLIECVVDSDGTVSFTTASGTYYTIYAKYSREGHFLGYLETNDG